MRFFARDAAERIGTPEGRIDWNLRLAAYEDHLDRLEGRIPDRVWELGRLDLHDALIVGVKHSGHEVSISLNTMACTMDAVAATLHFLDVQQSCVPATSVGAFWLYEEIDVSPLGGFRLDVLLDTDEIMIVAADVRVELVFGLP
jgi:uncharacterized protein DUF4085